MTAVTSRRWKGLETGQTPVFLSYDQTERMIAALLHRAAAWQPELVVGIARGGLVPASMAAGLLAVPLAMSVLTAQAVPSAGSAVRPRPSGCCWSTMAAPRAAPCQG